MPRLKNSQNDFFLHIKHESTHVKIHAPILLLFFLQQTTHLFEWISDFLLEKVFSDRIPIRSIRWLKIVFTLRVSYRR